MKAMKAIYGCFHEYYNLNELHNKHNHSRAAEGSFPKCGGRHGRPRVATRCSRQQKKVQIFVAESSIACMLDEWDVSCSMCFCVILDD